MPRTRVRSYDRGGRTVSGHTRRFEAKFRPRRALYNARRSGRYWTRGRYMVAVLFGTAATAEILGFFVFKAGGGFLMALGLALAGLGVFLRGRT